MEALILFLPVAVLIIVVQVVGYTRKGSVATVPMTTRRIALHSTAPPAVVYTWLTQHQPTGYSIDDTDPARGIVILSSPPRSFDLGFFYPTMIHPEGTGTGIEVGIKSKVIQYGPLVTRAHRKLAHVLAGLTHSSIEGG
jgi:hypothetical protein